MTTIIHKTNFNIDEDIPPRQEGKFFEEKKYSCFGYSLQGSSHRVKNLPCQDYNDFQYIEEADVVFAGIADGVGSCALSHWGSYIAVKTAIDYTKRAVINISQKKDFRLTSDETFGEILCKAFEKAADTVADFADEQNRPVAAFMSTLTLVLYDGTKLYCQHAGDDGVVVQFMNGSVEMITSRIKGEEASSVYPLQSGNKYWQFTIAGNDQRGPVSAFLMATDGVLDKFVMDNDAYENVERCCRGIYYPFMERSVYSVDTQNRLKPRKAEKALSYYIKRMNGEDYRSQVTDDLTLVSIINPVAVSKGNIPDFDKEIFYSVTENIQKRQRELLYSVKENYPLKSQKKSQKNSHIDVSYKGDSYREPGEDLQEEKGYDSSLKNIVVGAMVIGGCVLFGILMGCLIMYLYLGKPEPHKDSESEKTIIQEIEEPGDENPSVKPEEEELSEPEEEEPPKPEEEEPPKPEEEKEEESSEPESENMQEEDLESPLPANVDSQESM